MPAINTLARIRFVLALTAGVVGVGLVGAQNKQPTADDVKPLAEKYRAERSAAAEQKFPPQSFDLSDQLAKRAQTALEGNSYREALRLYREARWQIPYLPNDLPKGVSRV